MNLNRLEVDDRFRLHGFEAAFRRSHGLRGGARFDDLEFLEANCLIRRRLGGLGRRLLRAEQADRGEERSCEQEAVDVGV